MRLISVHDLIKLVCDSEYTAFVLSLLHLINQISEAQDEAGLYSLDSIGGNSACK